MQKHSDSNDVHYLSVDDYGSGTYDSGSGVHCMWQIKEPLEEIQFSYVEFYGFDTIITLIKHEMLEKLCQFGGLYVFVQT